MSTTIKKNKKLSNMLEKAFKRNENGTMKMYVKTIKCCNRKLVVALEHHEIPYLKV